MYKINFEKPVHVHFIGIGGISMSGLAAARTGQNEQRAVGGEHCLPLHIVQAAKLLFNIGIAQSAEFLLETCCHCFTCSSIKSLTL